jgi:kinesin family protein 1
LGVGILKNAWTGLNASLFAYGQTGSGKSYSVVGYGENKGIVPLICQAIFSQQGSQGAGIKVEVTFSMLEIYSEIVRDLLNSKADRRVGLTVRENPKIGFYGEFYFFIQQKV